MDDKSKLTDETKFPIPVPSTDTGWNAMRKRLDDEMPETAAIFAKKEPEPRAVNKLTRLLLLLLLFFVIGFIGIVIRNAGNNKDSQPGTISHEFSANEKQKQQDSKTAENYTPASNSEDNADQLYKKNTGNDLSATDPVNEVATNPKRSNKIITGNKNYTGLNTLKNIKTYKNRNALVKNKTSKAGKGKLNAKKQGSDASLPDNKYLTDDSKAGTENVTKNPVSNTTIKTNPEKRSDSIAPSIPAQPENSGWKLNGGLFWNLQVPTAATGSYFIGANAQSQPYRIILPGAWLQAQNEKHLLTLELNPFASNLVPPKPFRTLTTYENIPDTAVVITQTRTLRKVFGISAGFGYAYNVSGNWWLGSSLQSFWWRKAVAESSGEIQKYPTNGSPPLIIPLKENYPIDDEWSYFSNIQFYLNAEGIYRENKWQAGLRMGIAITPLAKNEGPSRSLRLELLYRLKLFNLKATENKKHDAWFR